MSFSSKVSLYGVPKVVKSFDELDKKEIKQKTKNNEEEIKEHIPSSSPSGDVLSDEQINKISDNVINYFKTQINQKNNLTHKNLNNIMISELQSIVESLKVNNLPNKPCYLNILSYDTLILILSFITPRELCCIRGVSQSYNKISHDLYQPSMNIFTVGYHSYFAYFNIWLLGVIICRIDTININTLEDCKGYHVQLIETNEVIYYTDEEILQCSFIGNKESFPKNTPKIKRIGRFSPFLIDPHTLCNCGLYQPYCSSENKFTAPSSCNVIMPGFKIPIKQIYVGYILDIDSLPKHPKHMIQALSIETNRKSISYKPEGYMRKNYYDYDGERINAMGDADTRRCLIIHSRYSNEMPRIVSNMLNEINNDSDLPHLEDDYSDLPPLESDSDNMEEVD